MKIDEKHGGRFRFFFSSDSGVAKGRRSPRRQAGVLSFQIQEGGGFLRRGGSVGRAGAGRVSVGRGGGLNILFRGRSSHQGN